MKRKVLFLSASLLAGLVGSAVLHRQKKMQSDNIFSGNWYYHRANKGKVAVTVTPSLDLYIQKKQQPVTIIEQTPHRLAFLDSMGYRIIFEAKEQQLFFYDETEDKTFPLTKQ